jgi:superfamily II DNA/RNA helicase
VAIDLISTLSPHLTMVFVASKAEADSVAGFFSTKLGGRMIVRVLHGDMVQSARSRTIALVKEGAMNGDGCQILVTTDVASRGIDLPVDLVIQFGVPRQSGKEGTYCKDLYTHRVGRTGRVRSLPMSPQHQQGSNAILLYDPEHGEGKLIQPLRDDIYRELGVWIEPRPLPSAAQVVDAAYEKTKSMIQLGIATGSNGQALTEYFRNRLEQEMELTNWKADELLEYLSRAMVHLSHIDPNYSPFQPPTASLLSASPSDRTIRVVKPSGSATPLSPTEVTRVCKGLGSGKLGKVVLCKDGSIVFDLPDHRARKLVEAASLSGDGADLLIELPWSLPSM